MTRPTDRYSTASMTLHWLMLALIAGVFAAIEFVAAVVDNPQLAEILSKMAARLPEASASSISGQNSDPSISI